MDSEWLRVSEEYTRKAMSTPTATQCNSKIAFALTAIAAVLLARTQKDAQAYGSREG
jgi:hypothetical protein